MSTERTVVITGASRGIGRAAAERFLAEGWRVIGTGTKRAEIDHENFISVALDLRDGKNIERAAQEVLKIAPHIGALINNAGNLLEEEADFVSTAALRESLEVHLIGAVDLTQRLLPALTNGSRIIFMSSGWGVVCGERDDNDAIAYSIAKAALGMYARLLANTVKARGIVVAVLDPGWVRTDMGGAAAPHGPEKPAAELFDLATTDIPTGKFWKEGRMRHW